MGESALKPSLDLSNVRKKPRFIESLPWIGKNTATALYPNVWLPRKVFEDLQSDNPDPFSVALVLHEQEHIKRMKGYGVVNWCWHYLTSRKFRFDEEIKATEPQFAHIKAAGLTFNIARKAKVLSGWLYFWPLRYDVTLERLNTLWESA
jgi:hypothetical protein